MPGFIVRRGGSREYLPKEYRGAPQEFYASRIRESKERQLRNSLQMKRAKMALLEKDLHMDSEVERLRARFRLSNNKTRFFAPRCDGIRVTGKRPIRFAPLV